MAGSTKSRGGSPDAMTSPIQSQRAAAESLKQAAEDIKTASEMMVNMLGKVDPLGERGPQPADPARGDTPTVGDNQTQRPDHGGYIPRQLPPQGTGINGLRQMASTSMNDRYGTGAGASYREHQDINGNAIGHTRINSNGTTTWMPLGSIHPDELNAGNRRDKIAHALSSGTVKGAMKAMPLVGSAVIAAEAGQEVLHQIGAQREANSHYQSIYGGSNFGTGVHNRRLQEGFKLNQMFSGGLTGKQSDQAFQGVSAMGFSGAQRDRDLDFITSSYKSMGMDVASSLQLIATASKSANSNLVGVATMLKNVSSAAKGAGLNAGEVRQMAGQTYANISQNFEGPGATTIAQNIVHTQVGLGRDLGMGFDISKSFGNLGTQATIASMNGGMTIPEVQGAIMGGQGKNSGPAAVARFSDQLMKKVFGDMVTPEIQAYVNDAVNKNPTSFANMSSGAKDDFYRQIGAELAYKLNVNPIVLMAKANVFLGPNAITDPTKALMLLVAYAAGQVHYSKDAIAAQKKLDSHTGKDVKLFGTNITVKGQATHKVVDNALKGIGPSGKVIVKNNKGEERVVSMATAAASYTDQVAKGTARDASTGIALGDTYGVDTTYDQSAGHIDTTKNKAKSHFDAMDIGGGGNTKGQSLDAYKNSKKGGGGGGSVTIEPNEALYKLLNFTPSGNVNVANQAANSGTTATPGTSH